MLKRVKRKVIMFGIDDQPVTNKKSSRYLKNKASGDAEELDKYGNPIKMMELANVTSSHERHLDLAKKWEGPEHGMICVLFQNATLYGEPDFNCHEKIVLSKALECTIEYLGYAVLFSNDIDKLAAVIDYQSTSGTLLDLRNQLFELYSLLTDPIRTFTFVDCRTRCKIARKQHLEAQNKGIATQRKVLKCAKYDGMTTEKPYTGLRYPEPVDSVFYADEDEDEYEYESEEEYAVQVNPLRYGAQVDDKLLHFGSSRLVRAGEIFKQLVFQVAYSHPCMVPLFEYMIELENNNFITGDGLIYSMEDVYDEL